MFLNLSLNFLFYIFSSISFLLTVFSDKFLPDQFLRDSLYLEQRINSNIIGYNDSFQVIANLYAKLGINQANIGLRIIEWIIFFLALIQVSSKLSNNTKNYFVFILTSVYLALIPFYGSLFTKEILVVVCINTYLFLKKLFRNKYDLFLLISMICLIIITIRKYYLITLIFMLFFSIIGRRSFLTKSLSPLFLISFLSTFDSRTNTLSGLAGIEIFQIRNITNDNLKILARSRILQSNISTNPIENIKTFGEVLVQVLFPFQLLTISFYSILTFFAVLVINFSLCGQFLFSERSSIGLESIFLFAFFSTSLIFEPDLGSYVRHGFVYIPFAIYLQKNQKKFYLT